VEDVLLRAQALVETFEKLGKLYKEKLGWMSEAIDAYEISVLAKESARQRTLLL